MHDHGEEAVAVLEGCRLLARLGEEAVAMLELEDVDCVRFHDEEMEVECCRRQRGTL
jgi:hypothetical protein